ncbi:Golgi membrane exchange factor (Ric1p-Rgp1p) subunit [Coemansia sp. RSA 2559]|nr:Golgi membrane exchange factor (Ric1p-Rgp1p) subunit [Coemansia sp. RSA 2559]
MQNIQIACRKRAPVFFSLSQDGHAVASVWLPKRVYQLGDMVSGRLDIHQGSASVYQVSIWLESVETVGSAFASYSQSRTEELTRRVYSEHHEFCRSTQTLGFSLAAPQPATAAASFNSSILTNVWQLRIELIIGTSDLAAASDYVLSAATPFPPAKQPYHASTDPRSSVLLMPAKGVPPMLPVDGQAALATKLRPIVPASASGSMSSRLTSNPRNGNSRLRSSTIADSGSVGVIGAVHCQGHHKSHDSDPKTIQPQSHVAADTIQRTVRRRYDAAHIIASQTLSCTVAIQMHPSSLKQLPAGHRDTYTVDLTSQGR